MPTLELKTSVINADYFHLCDEKGNPIPLPPEEGWKWTGDCEHPDQELALDLKPGRYWFVRSNNNVTVVILLTADESSLRHEEVSRVANGCSGQAEEVGTVALTTPLPVLDIFLKMAELRP